MEENIDKIFSILEDKKNEPLFKIYITQLAEINKNNPRSSNIILERALKLTRSNIWECRLVAASILEKVIDNHLNALQLFGANERITLEIVDGMFVIEDVEMDMSDNALRRQGRITDLKSLMECDSFLKLDSIDYEGFMNKETPLLSRDTGTAYKTKGNKLKEEKLEDEIFKKLEQSGDEKNVLSFLDFIESIKNEKDDYDKQSDKSDKDTTDMDMEEEDEKSDEEAEEMGKKGKGKIPKSKKNGDKMRERRQDLAKFESIEKKQKISDLNWKQGKTQNIRIRSVFKLVYDFLSKSLFNPRWEIRHGACIALRNFIKKDIHKLYINLNLARADIMAVDDQEESLTTFIRQTVKTLTFSNAFFEDFLSRQLVVIALDRFMDHSSDRTQIIVRENSCQAISRVVALLFGEDPIIYDRLYDIIDLFLKRNEWEIQIGALYLLKYVENLEEKTCPAIFERFGTTLLKMTSIDDNDDVLCVLAECLEIFVHKIPFAENIGFFRSLNEQFWKILESLDDISFSNSMVTSVLTALHQKADYSLLYPKGLSFQNEQENLLPLFQHKIALVRSSVYALEVSLLQIAKPANYKKSLAYFKKLLKLTVQNLMIEGGKAHVDNLLKLAEELFINLSSIDEEYCAEMLRYLLESSCQYNFKEVVKKFEHFAKVNFDPYSFVETSNDPNINISQIYERLLKTGILFNAIISRSTSLLANLKAIFGDLIGTNHFILLCYLFVMVETFTRFSKTEDFTSIYEKDVVDVILTWNYSAIKTPYLDMVGVNIQHTVGNMTQILESLLRQRNCSDFTKQIAQAVAAFNQNGITALENLYQVLDAAPNYYQNSIELHENERINLLNCIQSLQFQIGDYVTRSNELLTSLKTMCAGITIINSTIAGKPLEKLNAIIPPVITNLLKPNFVCMSRLTAFFLFLIIKFYEGSKSSPVGKIFKNIFVSIFEEKLENMMNKTGPEAPKLSQEEKKSLQENDFLVTGSRYEAFVEFVRFLYHKNQENLFKVYPILFENLTSEFMKLNEIDHLKISVEHMQYIKIVEIYKNLKLMNIVRKIQKELFSLKESRILVENLLKAFAVINTAYFLPNKDQQAVTFQEKCIKICCKLLRTYLNLLKEMKNEAEITFILEKLYRLLKQGNLIVLKFLQIVHETKVEEFIDYTKIFIIQCIKKINSEVQQTRKAAVRVFASMINSIFIKDTRIELGYSPYLKKKYEKGFRFVFEFKNNKNFDFTLQTKVRTDLRSYQVEGIKWLSFLVKYNMSAALCDDMGLGKTIQTLAVLQEEIFKQAKKVNEKGYHSIIVVPSSLTEHWHYEIQRFCDRNIIRPYVFSSAHNKSNPWVPEKYNLLIISYPMLSKHVEQFKEFKFMFMILDEAHLLKNPKSRTYKAIKEITAQHKVALTGTPIQNNIVELWSIFDVIMPGYLGDEEHFKSKYSKYFNTSLLKTAAKDMIITSEQDEILEELHRKVKPFILRRDKMSVLSELPPKVIQDYYCHMTEVQERVYREFERIQVNPCDNELNTNKIGGHEEERKKVSTHVFQLLNTLRRICNHPYLFIKNASSSPILQNLKINPSALETYEASGKLNALKDLFNEMGFEDGGENSAHLDYTNNTNKILLFSRYNETLDVINKHFISKLFPGLKYLRIDGSIPSAKRFEIVKKFNHDNNIKLLLLTTSVGGVGLNLHTANVVVMFDHDYNPMNDLQAIDRAHRIGQKNILNVYRLIMKDTLEEQIMGIQRFKINVANSVINIENASIENIKQSNLLSLFSTIKQDDKDKGQGKKKEVGYDKYSKILDELEELWSEDQYKKDF